MEAQNTESKEKFGDSALKAVCGMANTKGGKVIVDVTDDGRITGINISNEELEKISKKIADKFEIHPNVEKKEE